MCRWLLEGSPAGLNVDPEPCGIFPKVLRGPECSLDELNTDYASFRNYSGVDTDDTATLELEKHLRLKRLRAFETIEEPCVIIHSVFLGSSRRLLPGAFTC